MFLEIWMIVVLVLAFGACAYYSRRSGELSGEAGIINLFQQLELIQIIDMDDEYVALKPYGSRKKPKVRISKNSINFDIEEK